MSLCRLTRDHLGWPHLKTVARGLARRYNHDSLHIRFLEADNWLSTPMVIDDGWFVKAISKQNSPVHAVFATRWNLGVFSNGTEGFFGRFGTLSGMAEHELEAAEWFHDIGLQAPTSVEAFGMDGLGVLVLKYLPNFHTLSTTPRAEVERLAPELFATLTAMHGSHLAHGDLRAENVLVREDGIYFIDVTNVNDGEMRDACVYDPACGLAVLEPLVDPKKTVTAAPDSYDASALLDAVDFLDFVNTQPDHDFDATSLKGEIEKYAA